MNGKNYAGFVETGIHRIPGVQSGIPDIQVAKHPGGAAADVLFQSEYRL